MATGPQRFVPLVLTLDPAPFKKGVDDAAGYANRKLGGGSGGSPARPPGLTAEERRAAAAAEQLQRQRSASLIAEERRALAAVESLQKQRSAALITEFRRVEREQTRAAQEALRVTQQSEQAKRREYEETAGRARSLARDVALSVVASVALITAAVVGVSTRAALEFNSLKRGLVAVAGSTLAADRQLKELREVAKLPGLGIRESIQGAVKFQAAGADFNLTVTTLRAFGNALAIVGKGKQELQGVSEQIAQVLGKNKILAQDIRIISDYVPQLRRAILAAYGTADTEELQRRGVTAVDFLNRVNAELLKLPQQLGGPTNAIENFQDAVFLAAATFGEKFLPFLTHFLEFITPLVGGVEQFQEAIFLAVGAVGALSAAMLAFNTNAVAGSIALYGRLVSSLQAVHVSMQLVASGAATTAASAVVGVAGWVALAAAVGAVGYAVYSYVAAEEEAAAVSTKAAAEQLRSAERARAEAEALGLLTENTARTAEGQRLLRDSYESLRAAQQLKVDATRDETERVRELTRAKLEQYEADRLGAQATALQLVTNLTAALAKQAEAQERVNAAREAATRGPSRREYELQAGDVDALGRRTREATAAYGEARRQLEGSLTEVEQATRAIVEVGLQAGLSAETILQMAQAAGRSQQDIAAARKALNDFEEAQRRAGAATDETNRSLEMQRKFLNELVAGIDAAAKERRETIDRVSSLITAMAENPRQAQEMLAAARRNNFQGVGDAIREEQRAKAVQKALGEIIDPKEGRRQKTELESLTDRLRKLRGEVLSFTDLGSREFALRFQTEDLERVKRDFETILNLRRELGLRLDAPLPAAADLEGQRRAIESLERMKQARDQVRQVVDEQREAEQRLAVLQATEGVPVVDAGTRAQRKYLEAVRERQNAERELTADLVTQYRLRRRALDDEVGSTKKAYETIKSELLKRLSDLDDALRQNQVLRLLEAGNELSVYNRVSGRLEVAEPKVPRELVLIAENSTRQTHSLRNIELALAGGRPAAGTAHAPFSAAALLPELEAFLRTIGAPGAITARGQTATHNRYNLDHRNALDVGLAPGSPQGRALEEWLRARGAPFRAITAADVARGVKATAPHYHIGDPSRGTSADYRAGTLLAARPGGAAPESAPGLLDRLLGGARSALDYGSGLLERLGLSRDTQGRILRAYGGAAGAGAGGDEVVRINASTSSDDYLRLRHEESLKKAIKERGDLEQALVEEIRDNEYRLAFDLIDFDLQVSAARTRTRVGRRDEERSLAVELAELHADAADQEATARRQALVVRREELDLTRRAVALQDEYETIGVNGGLRQQVALMEELVAIKRADVEATDRQVRAQVRLADATVVHGEQVRASVLEHLADSSSLTEAWSQGLISEYERLAGFMDRGIEKLTRGAGLLDSLLKSIARHLLSRVWQQFLNALFPQGGGQRQAGGLPGLFGGAQQGGGFNLGSLLGGLFNTNGGGVTVGGFSGGLFNVGRGGLTGAGGGLDLGSLLASGGGANPGNPLARALSLAALDGVFDRSPQSLTAQAAQRAGSADVLRQVVAVAQGGGAGQLGAPGLAGLLGGGFSLGSLAASGGLLAPMLGLSLGGRFGGPLGAIGGGILGGLGFGLAGLTGAFGLGSTTSGIALGILGAAPFLLPIAGALLVGGYFMKRSQERRRYENVRNEISHNTGSRIWALIEEARRGNLTVAQAESEWSRIESDYRTQIAQIKESKTKRHAELQWKNDFAPLKAILLTEARQGEGRRARQQEFIPTYAQGGFVGRDGGSVSEFTRHAAEARRLIKVQAGERFLPPHVVRDLVRSGGIVPGAVTGRDDTYMEAPTGSFILPRPKVDVPQPFESGGVVGGGLSLLGGTGFAQEVARAVERGASAGLSGLSVIVETTIQNNLDGKAVSESLVRAKGTIIAVVREEINDNGAAGLAGDVAEALKI